MSPGDLILRGKVRDVRAVDARRLLIVASDRISAYDAVMPTPIPGKGQLLTALSIHWLGRIADIVPHHLLGWRRGELAGVTGDDDALVGRTMLVRRLRMFPIECVARGYLAGSGWREYRASGAICDHALPAGLREGDRLPEPIFTPATKASAGHDENITRAAAAALVGAAVAAELERLTLAIYRRGAAEAGAAGILLADTKLEFGRDAEGRIVLGDEVMTSDSSRFWPAGDWRPGGAQPSFDKQYVRDHLDAVGWDHRPPAPALPAEVVAGTRARYGTAYGRIAGRSLSDYLEEAAR